MRAALAAERPTLHELPIARQVMLAALGTTPSERISLHSAHGRTLAAPLYALADLIPYARSAMDGFAIRAFDVASLPATLSVVQSVYAQRGDAVHVPGTATAIATGAPLPYGADAVVPIESVIDRDAAITINVPVSPAENVFEPGQDASCGDLLVAAGDGLGPGALALLAAAGHASVEVNRRPRVAVVSSGDELVTTDAEPLRGQIRNSNGVMLAALAADAGADVVTLETLRDDLDVLSATFERLRPSVDALIITGGASQGPRDYVKAAINRLGARWLFTSVAMRPGRPTAIAIVNGTPVFILPGNPAAAFVAATLFVQPALRRMGGRRIVDPPLLYARLGANVRPKRDRHSFIFGALRYDEALSVVPLQNQCSSLVRTAASADALIVVEPSTALRSRGELLPLWPLRSACAT